MLPYFDWYMHAKNIRCRLSLTKDIGDQRIFFFYQRIFWSSDFLIFKEFSDQRILTGQEVHLVTPNQNYSELALLGE